MQVEKHEGDLDTAGRAVRVHDMVEDAAEVSLDMFWPDLPMVWKDELVLAKSTTAVYKRVRAKSKSRLWVLVPYMCIPFHRSQTGRLSQRS